MNIDTLLIGQTVKTLGEVLVGYMALSVHHRFKHEHKIDQDIFRAMDREWFFGKIGLVMIVVGFLVEVWGRN